MSAWIGKLAFVDSPSMCDEGNYWWLHLLCVCEWCLVGQILLIKVQLQPWQPECDTGHRLWWTHRNQPSHPAAVTVATSMLNFTDWIRWTNAWSHFITAPPSLYILPTTIIIPPDPSLRALVLPSLAIVMDYKIEQRLYQHFFNLSSVAGMLWKI